MISNSSCKQLDLSAEELWRISEYRWVFSYGEMLLYFLDLTLTGSEFHRVCSATEKALVPMFVLTLGMKGSIVIVSSHTPVHLACLSDNTNIIINAFVHVLVHGEAPSPPGACNNSSIPGRSTC